MTPQQKYYKYIIGDITSNLIFKKTFPWMFVYKGVEINSCNLNANYFYNLLKEIYGIDYEEFDVIVHSLIGWFDEKYPDRCNP